MAYKAEIRRLERARKEAIQRGKYERAVARHNAAQDRANRAGAVNRPARRRRGRGLALGIGRTLGGGAPLAALLLIAGIAFVGLGGLNRAASQIITPPGATGPTDIADPPREHEDPGPGNTGLGPNGTPEILRHHTGPQTPQVIVLPGAPPVKLDGKAPPGSPQRIVLPGVPYSAGATLRAPPEGIESPRLGDFIQYPDSDDVGDRIVRDLGRLYFPRTSDGIKGLTGPEMIALGHNVRGPNFVNHGTPERPNYRYRDPGTSVRSTRGTGTYADPIRHVPTPAVDLSRFTRRTPATDPAPSPRPSSTPPRRPSPRDAGRRTTSRGGTTGSVAASVRTHTTRGGGRPRPSSDPGAAFREFRRRYGV